MATFGLEVDEAGRGRVMVDGMDISDSVSAITIKIDAQKGTDIQLTLCAGIRGNVRAELQHVGIILAPEAKPHRDADGACTQCGFEI